MSHWNYRLTVRAVDDLLGGTEEVWELRELFYNDNGDVLAWTEESVGPHGSTHEDAIRDAGRIAKACFEPAFDLDTKTWRPSPLPPELPIGENQ